MTVAVVRPMVEILDVEEDRLVGDDEYVSTDAARWPEPFTGHDLDRQLGQLARMRRN